MAGLNKIDIQCFVSAQVRKSASIGNTTSDSVRWTVIASRPFESEENFGRLSQTLGLQTLCELCDFSQGTVGDVIDKSKTPEELGFRPLMAVYLRQKRAASSAASPSASPSPAAPAAGGAAASSSSQQQQGRRVAGVLLSADDAQMFQRLREAVRTVVTPDQPCPLCNRVVGGGGDTAGDDFASTLRRASSRARRAGSGGDAAAAAAAMASSTMSAGAAAAAAAASQFRLRHEVGVQCGMASRISEPPVPVAFGTAARFKQMPDGVLRGAPVDFPAPVTLGGPAFLSLDGEVTDLKAERDRLKTDRDALANALREEQRRVAELHRERQEHRCEGSAKVQQYVREIQQLQENLRDLMRGREEVFALLLQRRTAGAGLAHGEAPLAYAPFSVGVRPAGLATTPHPHSLLSKDLESVRRTPARGSAAVAYAGESEGVAAFGSGGGDSDGIATPSISVLKRPSGHIAFRPTQPSQQQQQQQQQQQRTTLATLAQGQPAGQCLLRIESSVGEHYYVKRIVGSHVQGTTNLLTLSSLDGVVTDEIIVDSLEAVAVVDERGTPISGIDDASDGALALATARHQWVLILNPSERVRWVHWLYALNPWLSTVKRGGSSSARTA